MSNQVWLTFTKSPAFKTICLHQRSTKKHPSEKPRIWEKITLHSPSAYTMACSQPSLTPNYAKTTSLHTAQITEKHSIHLSKSKPICGCQHTAVRSKDTWLYVAATLVRNKICFIFILKKKKNSFVRNYFLLFVHLCASVSLGLNPYIWSWNTVWGGRAFLLQHLSWILSFGYYILPSYSFLRKLSFI